MTNQPLEKVFYEIERTYPISFSYNSDIIPDRSITLDVKQMTLGKLLLHVLGEDYFFKSTGFYIIILRRNNPVRRGEERVPLQLTGLITNRRNSKPIHHATVYDMGTMQSTLTDTSGRFTLNIYPKTFPIGLHCSKNAFSDTVVMAEFGNLNQLQISLMPKENPSFRVHLLDLPALDTKVPTLVPITRALVSKEIIINSMNLVVFDHRPFQISLIPNVGSNLKLNGSIVNRFSVNLLAGFSAGVAGFEAGGFINMNRKDVHGFQISGIANLTGQHVRGFQAAGIMNQVRGRIKGMQLAGILNSCEDTLRGVQVAGLRNVCMKDVLGFQVSGGMNIAHGSKSGSQIAGVFNYAPSPRFQLGLINKADTSDGVPLGIVNLIKGGYFALSAGTDELLNTNLLLNMGTHRLYSMVGLTYCLQTGQGSFGFVYGLGSMLRPDRTLGVHLELMTSVFTAFGRFDSRTMSRLSLSPQLSLRLHEKLQLRIGPSANAILADALNPDVETYLTELLPKNTWHYAPKDTRFDTWLGGYAAISYKL